MRRIMIVILVAVCALSIATSAYATETLSLVRAASMGLVQLVSLGGYLGDTVQVIASGDPHEDITLQVRRGDILLNKSNLDQNMIVSHDTDIPLHAGAVTGGVWTLCLDWDKGSPKAGQILDVAPPLSDWPNENVDLLMRLLEQIDKYAVWADQYAQDAVWSITDNKWVVDSIIGGLTPKLLHAAKIKPNVYRVFPHLSNPLSGVDGTGFVVPPELLGTGDIQVTLTWKGTCDLDLHVIDPTGEDICWQNQPSKRGGVEDWHDMCDPVAHGGPENIYWLEGNAPSGKYTVTINYNDACGADQSTVWTVMLTINGEEQKFSGSIDPGKKIDVVCFDY